MPMSSLRPDHLTEPLRSRYSPRVRGYQEGMARHAAAVNANLPGYRDPATGLVVFTARFLAERGYCCSSGCRHCPYVQEGRE
ncbi:MAG: hypothetical protein KDB06_08865 [Ilumatobacter sp.]|nr:hypothetical protein [Ilumatobacter sp.]